jgi:hypothetical protein
MKNILLILIVILTPFKLLAQSDIIKIKIAFYVNNELIKDVKYYFIQNNGKAYLLRTQEGEMILKDTLTTKGIPLMAVSGKHRIIFPVYYYRKSDYIKIYYDNRIFGNRTKKNLGISRWRYLLRKEYYIDIEGFDDIITVFKSDKKYELVDKY